MGIIGDFLPGEGHSALFSTHITSDLNRIGDYLTLIHRGRVVRTGTKDEILDAHRTVRGGPNDPSGPVGVEPTGARQTPARTETPVRTDEATLLGGTVLIKTPSPKQIAIHAGPLPTRTTKAPNGQNGTRA